ncbi:MAG: DUF898 family protein [Pseudomonadota bacterium]
MASGTTGPWTDSSTDSASPTASAVPPDEASSASYLGWRHPKGMWGLSLVNFLLRMVTFGVYDFWGRTEVRRRLWSSIRFMGEPLVYSGTGGELFLGFLIIFGVILIPIILITSLVFFTFGEASLVTIAFQVLLYVALFFLVGIGIFRAQRYRLSRTSWRGIRGSLSGSSVAYGWTHFWTLLLIIPTLGWIIPWRSTKLQKIITSNTHFGDRAFQFDAQPGRLYWPFALLWFGVAALAFIGTTLVGVVAAYAKAQYGDLTLQTAEANTGKQVVGVAFVMILFAGYLMYLILSAWYRARMINHFAAGTRFEGGAFDGQVSGWGLIWVNFTNLLILSLGPLLFLVGIVALVFIASPAGQALPIGSGPNPTSLSVASLLVPIFLILALFAFTLFSPVTQARSMSYLIRHIRLEGDIPVEEILQSTAEQSTTGEGLAQAFDVDGF